MNPNHYYGLDEKVASEDINHTIATKGSFRQMPARSSTINQVSTTASTATIDLDARQSLTSPGQNNIIESFSTNSCPQSYSTAALNFSEFQQYKMSSRSFTSTYASGQSSICFPSHVQNTLRRCVYSSRLAPAVTPPLVSSPEWNSENTLCMQGNHQPPYHPAKVTTMIPLQIPQDLSQGPLLRDIFLALSSDDEDDSDADSDQDEENNETELKRVRTFMQTFFD